MTERTYRDRVVVGRSVTTAADDADLARRLGVTIAEFEESMRKLEAAGFMARLPDGPNGERVTLLTLPAGGEAPR